MNLRTLAGSARHTLPKPLFNAPVVRRYRPPQPQISEEEFRLGLLAGAEALRGLNLDDVFPANQTAHVEVRD
ncbi:MAG TPA: hypothetical protein VF665_08900 [Longimicrobium sp.]|uniref:hypothetical protein n=1 Tax=Longimicrobium sp. TaxID=2029185 RepID=UPI002ED95099